MGLNLRLHLVHCNQNMGTLRLLKRIMLFITICTLHILFFSFDSFSENLNLNFKYGINSIARPNCELPFELFVENRDQNDFEGYLDFNIYENNNSVYIYRTELSIASKNTFVKELKVSLNSGMNTIIINIYNNRDEIVLNERTNIDLSGFNNKLFVGLLSEDDSIYSYIDGVPINETGIETKLVNISLDDIENNVDLLNILDLLIITDFDYSLLNIAHSYNLQRFAETGKPFIISNNFMHMINGVTLPDFIDNFRNDARSVRISNTNLLTHFIDANGMNVLILPSSLRIYNTQSENINMFINIINTNCIAKVLNGYINNNSYIVNDYYNIYNLLNIIDKQKLPDIILLTALSVLYILVLTVAIYVFLRNINKRELYGKFVIIFSLVFTIIIFAFGFSAVRKNTFLTYISIVDIKDANINEKAFLNFRTSESGNYSFSTDSSHTLIPILRSNKEPIKSMNFIDLNSIKRTIINTDNSRRYVEVENASSFDSNVFVYENRNYLNNVYNINCSFERFNGNVTGRVTNNMNTKIRNASLLMHGKILRIGDIDPNYSVSLNRLEVIGSPVGNNEMLADILADDSNHNIVKYYLDENVNGYFDYAILIGFIDINNTIDISSNSVGDIYGKTLLAMKINDSKIKGIYDLSSLESDVENSEGFYDSINNSIRGDEIVINTYCFDKDASVSQIYIEGISNYDQGNLESNVPFYGDIYLYNNLQREYDLLNSNVIMYDELNKFLSSDNYITIKFVPSSRDPLYRKISLPVVRAIASK